MNGLQPTAEEKITRRYPPIYNPVHHEAKPLVVTDLHRNVLVWYLPHILTAGRQVSSAGTGDYRKS